MAWPVSRILMVVFLLADRLHDDRTIETGIF